MRQEGQPLDEDLATGVKELYLKAKETDDVWWFKRLVFKNEF
jgi:hypothetical protein